MENKISLVKVKNPFNKLDKTTTVVDYQGESLLDIRENHFPKDIEVTVSLNGKIIQEHDLKHVYLMKNDYVVFLPVIEGGSGNIFRVLAFVALIVVAIIAPYAIGAIGGIALTTAAGGLTFAGSMVTFGIMMLGGFLINALLPPHTPSPSIDKSDFEKSIAYSWSPQTTQQQGIVIPKIYGTVKSKGNVIAAFLENVGDSQNLNILLCHGYGPIKSQKNFMIQDQPAYNYKSVGIYSRRGDLNQEVVPNFNDTKVEAQTGKKVLYGSPIIHQTSSDDFDMIEVDIVCPNGLYYANDQGSLDAIAVNVSVEIANLDEEPVVYRNVTSSVITTTVPVYYYEGVWKRGYFDSFSLSFVVVETGSSNYQEHQEGEFAGYWSGEYGQYYQIPTYWHWAENYRDPLEYYSPKVLPKIRYVTTSSTQAYLTISGAQNTAIRRTVKAEVLTKGKHSVRISKLTGDRSSARYADEVYVSAVRTVYKDDFEYPRHVLTGVKALATDQLSGSFDFSCLVEGSYIRTFRPDEIVGTDGLNYRCIEEHVSDADKKPITGVNWQDYWEQAGHYAVLNNVQWENGKNYSDVYTWHSDFSDNPAWVCYDVLSQPVLNNSLEVVRYDGIDPSRLNLIAFKEWADYCDEILDVVYFGKQRKHTFNGTFDAETPLWEAANKVCQMSRTVLVWDGVAIKPIIDRPSQPVQMFSVGNILADSFQETFLSLDERASEIEMTFLDSEKDYEKEQLNVFNSAIENPSSRVSLDLFGVTNRSEAWREGMFRLYNNQYLLRTVEFQAQIDAIVCTVGDLIYIQHDIPEWSHGGRIVDATINTVTIDKALDLNEEDTYAIKVRLKNNEFIDRTVLSSQIVGDTTVITLTSNFDTIPEKYDVYIVGFIGEAKIFRVIDISYSSDFIYIIKAIEYHEEVYNCDTAIPDVPITVTYTRSLLNLAPEIDNLEGFEECFIDESDSIERNIACSFDVVKNTAVFSHADIYIKTDYASSWEYHDQTKQKQFKIKNVEAETSYYIKTIGVNHIGVKQSFLDAPSILITTSLVPNFSNETFIQNRVTGLQIFGQGNDTTFIGKDCKLIWNDINTVDDFDIGADEESIGAGTFRTNLWFRDYEVRIYNHIDNTLRRVVYVTSPEYTYTYEHNYEDGKGLPARSFRVEVRARDRYYRLAEAAKLIVSNVAPNQLTEAYLVSYIKAFILKFSPSTEPDVIGYVVHASQLNGFNPSEDNLIHKGTDATITHKVETAGTWYIKIAAYDTFGDVVLNYSPQFSIDVLETDPLDTEPPLTPVNITITTDVDQIDQTIFSYLEVSWDANIESDLSHYTVRLQKKNETKTSDYDTVKTSYKIPALPQNHEFDVSVAASDIWGNISDFTVPMTIRTAKDLIPPLTPSNFDMWTGFKKVVMAWTANTEKDLAGYEVHLSTEEDFTPTTETLIYSGMGTLVTYDGEVNTTYYAKVRAFDWSDNYSGFSTEKNATTAFIMTEDVFDQAITSAKIGYAQIDNVHLITATITGAKIADATIDTANIIDGAIVSAKIAEASIEDAHIKNVTADKIKAGKINSQDIEIATEEGMGAIRSGKNNFSNEDEGFILGVDPLDSKSKFFVGTSLSYVNWDGTDVVLSGEVISRSLTPGRYSKLSAGNLVFYKDFTAYKYLKEVITGTAMSGVTVTLYSDNVPEVHVSSNSLAIYDPEYSDQKQVVEVKLRDGVIDNEDGSYSFTPICKTLLSDNSSTKAININDTMGNSTYTSPTWTTPPNTTKILVTGFVNSKRGTGTSPNWYYRECDIYLYYRVSPSGGWSFVTINKQHGNDFVKEPFTISREGLTTQTYDYYIYVEWSDAGGTFSDGSSEYEYDQVTRSNMTETAMAGGANYTWNGDKYVNSANASLSMSAYSPPYGWTIYSVYYEIYYYWYRGATYARSREYTIEKGTAPVSNWFYVVHHNQAGTAGGYYTKYSTSLSAYHTTWTANAWCEGEVSGQVSSYVKLKNVQAIIYIRKKIDNSTTQINDVEIKTADFELSEAEVIDENGIVNWIAIA